MSTYTRLYLVPVAGQPQQVIDVDSTMLIKTCGGFKSPAVAESVTLQQTSISSSYTPVVQGAAAESVSMGFEREVRICWREPVGTDDYPNEDVIEATDPSGGVCVCQITCDGVQIAYANVQNVVN